MQQASACKEIVDEFPSLAGGERPMACTTNTFDIAATSKGGWYGNEFDSFNIFHLRLLNSLVSKIVLKQRIH